jgi:hypothetical protein
MLTVKVCVVLIALFHGARVRLLLQETEGLNRIELV